MGFDSSSYRFSPGVPPGRIRKHSGHGERMRTGDIVGGVSRLKSMFFTVPMKYIRLNRYSVLSKAIYFTIPTIYIRPNRYSIPSICYMFDVLCTIYHIYSGYTMHIGYITYMLEIPAEDVGSLAAGTGSECGRETYSERGCTLNHKLQTSNPNP